MAKVTVNWRNKAQTSFETTDPKTIARYESYALTDPGITSVTVTDDTPAGDDSH